MSSLLASRTHHYCSSGASEILTAMCTSCWRPFFLSRQTCLWFRPITYWQTKRSLMTSRVDLMLGSLPRDSSTIPSSIFGLETDREFCDSLFYVLQGGLRPHMFCLPILKHEKHRQAIHAAAISGDPRFFLGTDSAPHARGDKVGSRCIGNSSRLTSHWTFNILKLSFASRTNGGQKVPSRKGS